ncbi:GNAT family N-acetyltransferase [Clostridium intestinale]|uniref:GNAT family N-acetyltransferase n=1 Tax=Clostridium intestinale TaxID=36845 RepID=A0A7D6ZGP5_9CLOT|nr:GNAT family N-acetyltransferase [Clostridium intestinale]QLY79921.1 GNAT family N-acetyltransferase [Clostridium intestinale]
MINYIKCTDIDKQTIYKTFIKGFSDYIIKFEIKEDDFFHKFFEVEGNSLDNSYIAIKDGIGLGIILGGIKSYEGIKTLRCGALAVDNNYRGHGISEELFKLHLEDGRKNGCRQLFLEVIKGNDRAINFYKKQGYESIYNISYFSLENSQEIKNYLLKDIHIKIIDIEEYEKYFSNKENLHIPWQNDIDYIKNSKDYTYYGAYNERQIVGCISINDKGRIGNLHVDKAYRLKGIASNLLVEATKNLNLDKLNIGFTNNASLERFLRKLNFNKQKIEQHEMYKVL